ncbi:MAG: response regulator [Lachnospiraceae bacterium]|jgi:signal transduction histidine kinase/CheY-like chemotaxis protein/HPt (histidine-containing phosphotransfer) domain-containing protein|nr:response regulator [Lachnospiraceae bacterium]
MKAHVKTIILFCSMIFTIFCILAVFMFTSSRQMRRSGDEMSAELEQNAEDNVRRELQELVVNISDFVIAFEEKVDHSMFNAVLVLYELDRLSGGTLTLEELEDIKVRTGMSDMYIGDLDGIFTLSTEPNAIGDSLFEIWDGYRALVTGEADYLPSDLTVKAETGEIFKFTAITRGDNRGVLESAMDASIIEHYLQHKVENYQSIRAINLFNFNLMTLTCNHAEGFNPVFIKGTNVEEMTTPIDSLFEGLAEIDIRMDKRSAQIYYPIMDGDRVRYVLYVDIDTTTYFLLQSQIENSIRTLVRQSSTSQSMSFGVIFGVLFIFTVVISTISSRLVRNLEATTAEAALSSDAKSSFLRTMSHEIRTPLNAILGIAEVQLQDPFITPETRDGLEKIYASGDMLLCIINDILDLTKIESGKLELIDVDYDVANLISSTAQINAIRIGDKSIEFKLNIDKYLPAKLYGDELRIKQILSNILSNAFKYTDTGTVSLSVTSMAEGEDKAMMIFNIKDTGQGMSQEQIRSLFDEYSQFNQEANRTSEGTGLGLNITRNLIRMMKGTINVESMEGVGSTFIVRIPQIIIGTDKLGEETANHLRDFRSFGGSQIRQAQIFTREPMPYGRVLIVDDVSTNIFVASGFMTLYGLNIDSAESGFIAIDKVKDGNEYDIIFMDHMMPEMDGMETTEKLREMGYDKPIVALTANAVVGQAEKFIQNGFNDFMTKPIDANHLNIVLNQLIRDKQPPEVIEEARKQAALKGGQSGESLRMTLTEQITESFLRDAKKSLAALDTVIAKEIPLEDGDLRTFIIHTHGIKSALANIGQKNLSAIAMKLEQCGRDEEWSVISAETPPFLDELRAFVSTMEPQEELIAVDEANVDMVYIKEQLSAIMTACNDFDEDTVETLLKEMKATAWPQPIKDLLNTISEQLLHSDFDEAVDSIKCYLEANP